jgi:ribosomal protein S27AE
MSQPVYALSELRLEENPFHSALSKPWGMIVMGGLLVRLHLVACGECGATSLLRRYYADKVALLWPDDGTPEATTQRETLGRAKSYEHAMMVMNAPCWVHGGPYELKNLRTGLPGYVQDYFKSTKQLLAHPLATKKSVVNSEGVKVLTDFCPHCDAAIDDSKHMSNATTTLMVTSGDGEPVLLPIPLVCEL